VARRSNDADANASNRQVISAADSRVKVLVIATNEEQMIAHHTVTVLAESDQICPRGRA
tara:strand:+ start:797 stop:973 length:177 start_codon:yes stop_codon:yes gene_type:complete